MNFSQQINTSLMASMNDFLASHQDTNINNAPEEVILAHMGFKERIAWDIMFMSIISVAIVGNSIVLWIILGKNWSSQKEGQFLGKFWMQIEKARLDLG